MLKSAGIAAFAATLVITAMGCAPKKAELPAGTLTRIENAAGRAEAAAGQAEAAAKRASDAAMRAEAAADKAAGMFSTGLRK